MLAGSLRKRILVGLGLLSIVFLLVGWSEATAPRFGPHSAFDIWRMRSAEDGLLVQRSVFFATAGRCSGCHGHDTLGLAMVAEDGTDVNVADDWRSTMMANSARDPFFRAKVDHEVLVNPSHRTAIENKCLSCHAPLGMHEERMLNHPPFTLAMLDTSVMGQEGVSCLACHMQAPGTAGSLFSGDLRLDSARVYGPYPDDVINAAIMEFFVGFRPGYGQHIQDGRVCAGCHSLITETLDLSGVPTGGTFIEQATWHEWKNSVYQEDPNATCRGCHMPRIQDDVILASEYAFLQGHSPFGMHHLAGGNTMMLRLLKANKVQLGIPATDAQFDSTIARSLRQLHSSVDLALTITDRTADTAYVDAHLVNLVGHKFPSGYPSRRAILQVIAIDDQGDTLFQSGRWDGTNEVYGHDLGYESHHDVITQGDQVQLYEMVMGDVSGSVTTVLERAATKIKDNRLPPQGFSTTHIAYDTARIEGVPASDLDFNRDALGVEGNGGDIVHYHIALNGYSGPLHVQARVYFQPVPPLWNAEMFSNHSAAIDTFRTMYAAADGVPELVAADSLFDNSSGLLDARVMDLQTFPNPTRDGAVAITGKGIARITVFNAAGERVPVTTTRRGDQWRCVLPEESGVYHLLVVTASGERLLRVIRTRDR
jgi:Cytochrome c554 and c-prime